MLKPDFLLERVVEIAPEHLKKMGAKALIKDVDNTLSTHHGMELVEGLENWIEKMKEAGVPLLILSNSKEERVKPFAKKIGLPFIALGLKPLPFGYIRAAKSLGLKVKETALAGDQVFTDYLGARLSGAKIFLLKPIKLEDKLSFKIRRYFERKLLKKVKKGRFQ